MSLVINTNTASMSAQRQIMRSGDELDRATTRLSSGKRINAAADDAAGLAISSRMTSQVRGLDQAIRNANDGISMIQVAEGALNETSNMLQRIREISIQAANGIYSDGDRATLNAEVKQLLSQVDFVAQNTEFNGKKILDGSGAQVDLQVGADANQTVSFNIPKVDTKSLGISGSSGELMGAQMSVTNTGALSSGIPAAAFKINGKGIEAAPVGTKVSDLVNSINESFSDIEASTMVIAMAKDTGNGILSGSQTLSLSAVNMDGSSVVYTISNTSNLDELVSKINEKTGNVIQASIEADGKLSLTSSSLATLTIVDSTGGVATGISLGVNPDPNVTAIVQALQTGWISESENLISTYFGLSGDGVDLTLDINPIGDPESDGPSNNIASVSWAAAVGQRGINLELNIDMADFTPASLPNGNLVAGIVYSDRIIAHEMVHAVMTRNMAMDALPGWFTEGVAEFIHGADERVKGDINSGALDTLAEFQGAFTAAQAVGSPPAVGYSAGYVAVKMLHQSIINAGGTGIIEVFAQMKVPGPALTLDQALQSVATTHSIAAWSDRTSFETWVSTDGFDFMTSVANAGLTTALGAGKESLDLDGLTGVEADTGSIAGSDYGFAAITNANVLLDNSGLPAQNFNFIIPAGLSGGSLTADAQLVLKSKTGEPISIEKGAAGSDAVLESLGFMEQQDSNVLGRALSSADQSTALASNDLIINGVSVGATLASTGLQGKVDAINKVSEQTSVQASLAAVLSSRFNSSATTEIRASSANIAAPATGVIGINGIGIAITAGETLQTVAANINTAASATGVMAYVDDSGLFHMYSEGKINLSDSTGFYTALNLLADSGTAGSLKIKGIEINLTDITNASTIVSELNTKEAQTGVHAKIDENGSIVLSGSSAFNISLGNTKGLKTLHALGLSVTLAASGADLSDTTNNNLLTDETIQVNARIRLTSLNDESIRIALTDNGATATGLMQMNLQTQHFNGSALSGLNILTLGSAQKAIATVDNALKTINDTRSSLGAVNNRLDFTVANLGNISEKTTAALSRIVDTDFAQETAKLSRSTVLLQAAQAMLAQANQRPNQVLSLLR